MLKKTFRNIAQLETNTLTRRCTRTQADKEAEYIAKAIGAGRCPPRSDERPLQRKKEEDCWQILSNWCENPAVSGIYLKLGGISADELLSYIGTPLLTDDDLVQSAKERMSSDTEIKSYLYLISDFSKVMIYNYLNEKYQVNYPCRFLILKVKFTGNSNVL